MATAFHQWESDPLFSAAEVVQDSADRMESIFRLLLHEQSLVQGNRPDPKLLASMEYHRRDLATTLETAKWQLEDFEKAVSLSAITDKSRMREDVNSRHKQFIEAIREQIIHVEKSLEDPSMGSSMRNTEWVNLNEQDRDGLALFLSGGNPIENVASYGTEDSSIMRRFLDPTTASSSNDSTSEIVEHKTREIENLNTNGIVHVDRTYNSVNENKLRKVGSYYSTQMGSAGPDFLKEISCERHGEDGSWDLEANESKDKSFFHKNNWRGYYSRTNIFEFFGNLWSAYGNTGRVSRNFTKRLKDGEEQRHSQSYVDISHAAKGHHIRMRLASGYRSFQRLCSELFTRIMHSRSRLGTHMANRIQNNQHSIQLILALLFTLMVLGVLASQVA